MNKQKIDLAKKQKMTAEEERWFNYRKANDKFPEVRNIELTIMKDLVNPQKGETILECGTGNGYLTFPMAKAVGENGKIITYDTTEENLKSVEEKNKNLHLPITTKKQTLDYSFEEQSESIDKIATIATFHHYDNRKNNTKTSGKLKALKEFARILKPNGKLIIGDVANGTEAQRYFDSIDNPQYCFPNGHPHDFMDEVTANELCKKAGFKLVSFKIIDTPWKFTNEQQARSFLHTIHNAKVSPEESLKHAKKFLAYKKESDGKTSLGWKLFYLIAEKANS